jgi:hypothetical protein
MEADGSFPTPQPTRYSLRLMFLVVTLVVLCVATAAFIKRRAELDRSAYRDSMIPHLREDLADPYLDLHDRAYYQRKLDLLEAEERGE